jgi:rhodanese-related sulfurtransferase
MKNWIDLGEIMVIIDVSPMDVYAKGHLPNAVNAPLSNDEESPTDQLEAFLAFLPENTESTVVVYTEYAGLGGGHRAAVYAMDAGYTNVYLLPGGSVGWKDAGNKLTKK